MLLKATNLAVEGVFLDISKAFDRVWLKVLLYNICMDGNFLNGRCHIVVLNGHVLS